jgi:hypothetical protein|tara:strand:- start:60 stop:233 length:174 start_codon:yes stop_codon:yes gene_type:complete
MAKFNEQQEEDAVIAFIDPDIEKSELTNTIMKICVRQFPCFSEAVIFNSIIKWKVTP